MVAALTLCVQAQSWAWDDGTTPFVVSPDEVVERMLYLAQPRAGERLGGLGARGGRRGPDRGGGGEARRRQGPGRGHRSAVGGTRARECAACRRRVARDLRSAG